MRPEHDLFTAVKINTVTVLYLNAKFNKLFFMDDKELLFALQSALHCKNINYESLRIIIDCSDIDFDLHYIQNLERLAQRFRQYVKKVVIIETDGFSGIFLKRIGQQYNIATEYTNNFEESLNMVLY